MNADRIPRGEPGSVCPSWVYDGRYPNNPNAQKAAIARWSIPVTTPEERRGAQLTTERRKAGLLYSTTSHPCVDCGRFAFPEPTTCFWCRT